MSRRAPRHPWIPPERRLSLAGPLAQAALLLLGAFGVSGCGNDEERAEFGAAPQMVRLLDHLDFEQGSVPATETLARWSLSDGATESPFVAQGHHRTLIAPVPVGSEDDRSRTRTAMVIDGEAGYCAIARPETPISGISAVEAEITFHRYNAIKRMDLQVAFIDPDGRELHRSLRQVIRPNRVPQRVVFPVPGVGTQARPVASIQLISVSGGTPMAVVSLTAQRTPWARLLPMPGSSVRWSIGQGSRQAIGVTAGAPLSAELDIPDDATLDLSYAWPSDVNEGSAPPTIEVLVIGKADRSRVTMKALGDAWSDRRISMKQYGGERVRVRISVDQGIALLGDGTISSRVNHPRTVLLVTSDTHRGDYLGYANPSFSLSTPVIDRLAADGATFLDCTSTTNITNPSHVAIMTGIHPRDTGIVNNFTPIRASADTLAERFQAAGYRTLAAISTQHLVQEQSGLGQGFDRVDAPADYLRDGSETVDRALEWIKESDGVPLFVWLHLFDPHAPYDAPPDHLARHAQGLPQDTRLLDEVDTRIPGWVRAGGMTMMGDAERRYRAEIETVDTQLGRLMELPRFEQGWIAFTGDHGESFGSANIWWGHETVSPVNLFVPFFIRGPGIEPQVIRGPVQHMDFGATLLSATGVDARGFPGEDLLQVERPDSWPRFAISNFGQSASVTQGRWHLELTLKSYENPGNKRSYAQGEVRLKNLDEAEPRPSHLDTHMELAARMRSALITWLTAAEDAQVAHAPAALGSRAKNNLAALGYASEPEDMGETWWSPGDESNDWIERFGDE